jgi:H+/Cl- antiporter ClcA
MKKKQKSTLRKIEHHSRESFYLIVRGTEVGLMAGLVCVAYRKMLALSEGWLFQIIDIVKGSPLKTALWLIALGFIGVAVSYIVKLVPDAGGSGIPQVTGEVKGYLTSNWVKVLAAKLVGGTLSVFAGLSLGREGPSVQLGGMAAKGVARVTKADKTTTLRMISCGAGAGLSAAFNAPLAGIMFVLEEIHRTFDKSILCMGIVAAVVADYVSKFFFGQNTIFNYQAENMPLRYYWLLIIMGLLLGLLGAFYNCLCLKRRILLRKSQGYRSRLSLHLFSSSAALWAYGFRRCSAAGTEWRSC